MSPFSNPVKAIQPVSLYCKFFSVILLSLFQLCICALPESPAYVPPLSAVYGFTESEPCLRNLLRSNGWQCRGLKSDLSRLSVHHCSTENGLEGVLVIRAAEPAAGKETEASPASRGQDVFRVRLTGPEIVLADVHYCGTNITYAHYKLTRGGLFDLEVLHLYSGYQYEAPVPANERIHLAATQFTVPEPAQAQSISSSSSSSSSSTVQHNSNNSDRFTTTTSGSDSGSMLTDGHSTGSHEDAQSRRHLSDTFTSAPSTQIAPDMVPAPCSAHGGSCPFCTDTKIQGRWLVGGGTGDPTSLGLRRTCTPGWFEDNPDYVPEYAPQGWMTTGWWDMCLPTWQTARTFNLSQLQFQAYSCNLRTHEQYDLATCMRGRKVCFIGDSQLRVAKNVLAGLMEGRAPDNATEYEEKRVLYSPYASLLWDPWGEVVQPGQDGSGASDQAARLERLEGCTHVVMNFGQWHASHHAFKHYGKPLNAAGYARKLQEAANFLLAARQHGMQVYFATTNPVQFRRDFHGAHALDPSVAMMDFRTDPVLLMFNAVAGRVMEAAGIEVLDFYAVSGPLSEVSFDGTHYIGHVGYALNQLVLNAVCKDYGK